MIRKLWILLILSSISSHVHAQKQAANWYFGENAGIRFEGCDQNPSAISDGALNTKEGSTSISDKDGNLLFYTNGEEVYDKNNNTMPGGTGLHGDKSSTQSAIIVPKPADPNIYYIFTVGTVVDTPNEGFEYSVVDMSLNGGLGTVTQRNIPLLDYSSEKITATFKNPDGSSIWVITFASEDGSIDSDFTQNLNSYNTFHAFEINENGVSVNSVRSSAGPVNIGDRRGYLKISPNGKKLVCANTSDGTFLYDFNQQTGQISNRIRLNLNDNTSGWSNTNQGYGVEFSSNSKLLYVTSYNGASGSQTSKAILYQFETENPNSNPVILDRQNNLYRGALQLGPNGKIYRAMSINYNTSLDYLAVINEPNKIGLNCDYNSQGINLAPGKSTQGLPPFIQSFFFNTLDVIINGNEVSSDTFCKGDEFTLDFGEVPSEVGTVAYKWTFNGGSGEINVGTDNPILEDQTRSGIYKVEIIPNDPNICPYSREIEISLDPLPEAFTHEIAQCATIGNTKSVFSFPDTLTDPDTLPYYDYLQMTCNGDPICIQNILNNPLELEYFEDNMANVPIDNLTNYESEAKTIWIRTRNTSTESQCASDLVPLTLTVNPLGDLNTDTTALVIAECNINDNDLDGNARGAFDLNKIEIKEKLVDNSAFGLDPSLINDYNYSFYEVLEDAQLRNSNAIDITSTYLSKAKDIFIRVDDLTSGSGCVGISKIKLIVEEGDEPKDYTNENLVVCKTFDDIFKSNITLQAIDNLDPDADYYFEWFDGSGNIIYDGIDNFITINLAGTYTYTIYKTHSADKENYAYDITCETSGSVTINPSEIAVFDTPTFETTDGKDYNSITVYVNGDGIYEFALYEIINGDEYKIEDYQTSNIFNNIQAGNFRVYVRDTKYPEDIDVGCGVTEDLVSIIGFPKFFTPRKNGKNDFWQIKGAGLQPDSRVEIYDRYGKLIQELSPNMQGWDGTYKGNPMPANDYWFKALLQDGRVIYDHFSLVR